jgi:hypothetical protein
LTYRAKTDTFDVQRILHFYRCVFVAWLATTEQFKGAGVMRG